MSIKDSLFLISSGRGRNLQRSAFGERPAGVLGPAASRLLRVRPLRAPLGHRRPLDGASRHARCAGSLQPILDEMRV